MTRRQSESLIKSSPKSVDRKSVLDSLVKRRRESTTRSKLLSTPFESEDSEDSNSSDDGFVVSDSDESYDDGNRKKQRVDLSGSSDSSASSDVSDSSDSSDSSSDSDSSSRSCDYGFYARVSSLIDKKREKLKTIADTMSPRQAFQLCMQYYAMCLVSRGCKYPENSENKKLARILPELKVAVRRVERELMSRRDNIRPSYWKDESLLVRATQRYPILELIDHRGFYHHKHNEEPCAACNRMGWSWEVRFRGDEYNSKGLWLGEIAEWLKAMGLEPLGKAKLEPEDDSGDEDFEVTEYISRRIELGSQCSKNVEIYHALQHSKNLFIREIYDFIKNSKIDDSLTTVVRTFKNPKNHFVGKLYEKYNELIQLSESRFDFDDHNEPGQTIKLTPKKKHRHSNRF